MTTTEYSNNTFIFPFWPSLMAITGLGLNGMFLMLMLGIHPFLTVVLMVGIMYLGVGLLTGSAVYSVSENGLDQRISPLSWFKFPKKNIHRHFSWDDIVWYNQGNDLSRSLIEYQYLNIKLKKFPYKLQLNDRKGDKQSFLTFVINFALLAELQNRESASKSDSAPERISEPPNPIINHPEQKHQIEFKPDFYKTTKAKIIFWIFTLSFIAIIWAMNSTGIVKWTYVTRFLFIIIPGLGYMYYRIFVRK